MRKALLYSLGLLILLGIIGIDFFCPYRYDQQFEDQSYHPPQITTAYRNVNPALKIYEPDPKTQVEWDFFVKGYEYSFLGFTCNWHLFARTKGEPLFLLGSDQFGRDVFSRLVWGTRISMTVACVGVAVTFALGLMLGGLAGYCGGLTDRIIMRLCEVLISFPFFFLMLALRGVFPSSMTSVQMYLCIIVLMSLVSWPGLARVIRGMVLSIKERDFVLAMRCAGMGHARLIRCYILPHTYSYAFVAALLNIPAYILAEAGLSFLGLGIQDPYSSWGNMLQAVMNLMVLQQYPWMLVPGAALFVTILLMFVCGERLRKS